MPDNTSQPKNAQTLVIRFDDFSFETMEQENGCATVVRFRVDNPQVSPGDVLLILSGTDVMFHGMIGRMEQGMAVASDHRGSLLPAVVH